MLNWRRDWQVVESRIQTTSRLLASVAGDHIENYLRERSNDILSLKHARLAGQLESVAQFRQRAAGLRANHPEYVWIGWLDAQGIVRWWESGASTDRYRGFDVKTLPQRADLLRAAARRSDVLLSPVYQLINGEWGLSLYIAIHRNERLDGYGVAGLREADLVENSIPSAYRGKYGTLVRESGGQILASFGTPPQDAVSEQVSVLGRRFDVQVWPTEATRTSLTGPTPFWSLVSNLALALVVSVVVWSALRERRVALQRAEERRMAADALRRSEQQMREIVERSPWVIIEYAPDGTIEYVNPAGEQVYRLRRDEMVGRLPDAWIHPEDLERTKAHIAARFNQGEAAVVVNRNLDSAGGLHYMRWTGGTRRNARGEVVGAVSYGLDITAEVLAAQERERLQAAQQHLIERLLILNDFARSLRTTLDLNSLFRIAVQAVSRMMPDGHCAILTYDPRADELVVAAVSARNDTASSEQFWRLGDCIPAADTDLGDALRECRQIVTEDLSLSSKPIEKELAAKGSASRVAVPILQESGCAGLLSACSPERGRFTPAIVEFLRGMAEHLALAMTNARLFHELRVAYDQLRTTQDQVAQMERLRAVGEMAEGIAHDFNNSLAAIIGFAELLEERPDGPERLTYAQNILKAADDAAQTVRRIREFSRQRRTQESLAALDINVLAQEAIALTRHKWRDAAQSRGATISVEVVPAPDLPPVMGNAAELREVLTNLIFNAVDAMPNGGQILLRTGQRGGRTYVAVEDTGIGMSEETRRRVFEPFFSTKGQEGSGLGLAVSYGIIQRHGGEIEVQTTPGTGSTFTVLLPCAIETRLAPEKEAESEPNPRLTVLVIEDEPVVREVMTALLEQMGHQVVPAADGAEGLERLREQTFDALITDLGMPGMSGLAVAAAARHAFSALPIILLTGWGDQMRATSGLPEGVDMILSKPVRLEALRDALRQVVKRGA